MKSVVNASSLRETITQTAQAILDVRSRYPSFSLADLYDELTMPPDLRKAHRDNDRAVLAAYNLPPDIPEPALVAHLMSLYQKLSANISRANGLQELCRADYGGL